MISVTKLRRVLVPASLLVAFAVSGPVVAEPDMGKYAQSCGICHAAGVAGAPKTGDATAWAPRLAKGNDVLVASVKNGLNAMPPTGLCGSCTDEEYVELITYMATAK